MAVDLEVLLGQHFQEALTEDTVKDPGATPRNLCLASLVWRSAIPYHPHGSCCCQSPEKLKDQTVRTPDQAALEMNVAAFLNITIAKERMKAKRLL